MKESGGASAPDRKPAQGVAVEFVPVCEGEGQSGVRGQCVAQL